MCIMLYLFGVFIYIGAGTLAFLFTLQHSIYLETCTYIKPPYSRQMASIVSIQTLNNHRDLSRAVVVEHYEMYL